MHESHRQEYLATMGIEAYIPRWKIPYAAESQRCHQSYEIVLEKDEIVLDSPQYEVPELKTDLNTIFNNENKSLHSKSEPSKIIDILQQFEERKLPQIQPFSLSIWRPTPEFLIVAKRNINAMPTELLLNNYLRFYFKQNNLTINEEILRWPAIEASKIALTEKDACTELQTWLSVQHEFQAIKTLWFFGDICRYFIPEFSIKHTDQVIDTYDIKMDQESSSKITAKIFPDLSQFLHQPQLKAHLLTLP